MKYLVNISYTNPAHEHVSLRRRVDTVSRVVEARSETEAINRAANQQRALGFMIKEAKVVQPEQLKEGFDTDPKDIAAYLVNRHGKGKVTMDHIEAYERRRDSYRPIEKHEVMKHVKKMSEEVEEIDEAQKKLKPSYWRAEWRLGTQTEVDKNNKKIYDKLAKTDPEKAKAFHDNLMKMRKEEVEQTDEALLPKQQAVADKLKASELAANKEKAGYKFGKSLRDMKVAAKMKKEEVEAVDEKMNLATAKMGDVIKDFQKSDAPQFKGKSMEKRREMAIAAKLGAEREVKEENEPMEEKYMGFKKLVSTIKAKGGARDPEAVAAAIGRKKYGAEKFQAAAAAGKKMSEALDPVGREDKDIDNDGDSDKTDMYLSKRRKAIGAAIRKKVASKMGK